MSERRAPQQRIRWGLGLKVADLVLGGFLGRSDNGYAQGSPPELDEEYLEDPERAEANTALVNQFISLLPHAVNNRGYTMADRDIYFPCSDKESRQAILEACIWVLTQYRHNDTLWAASGAVGLRNPLQEIPFPFYVIGENPVSFSRRDVLLRMPVIDPPPVGLESPAAPMRVARIPYPLWGIY